MFHVTRDVRGLFDIVNAATSRAMRAASRGILEGLTKMSKTSKQHTNVSMQTVGTYPSDIAFGDFALTTEHPGFAPGLEQMSAALGINPKGAFYLLQYGLSQSMQDSIAGMAKKLDGAVWTEEDEKSDPDHVAGQAKFNDVEKKAQIHDALAERFATIRDGNVGSRSSGPRAKGIDKVIREYAWEVITTRAQMLGKSAGLPKKASERDIMIDKYLANEARAATAWIEAKRRMTEAKASGAEFNELFADITK